MMKRELENRVGFILAWGALAVSILVTDRLTSDPVNVSKLLLLSVIGFSLIPIFMSQIRQLLSYSRGLLVFSLGFLISLLISVFTSDNPIERGLYGAYGRNTGFIAYVSLMMIFLSAILISREDSFRKVSRAFFISGIVNIVLCLLAASGNDILTWDNPYNAVLGTFGNPNFISSFMGIFITFLVVQLLGNGLRSRMQYLYALMIPFAALTIYFSKALQGTMVALFGVVFAVYFFLRSKQTLYKISQFYLVGVFISASIAMAGILNKGPLATYLFSSTVKFRGEYWRAGINMGIEYPLSGVGVDSYGTYYRTFRELSATVAPGVEVGTDTAHNVYIDIFSGAGFPGLIFFLLINGFVLLTAIRVLKKSRAFDAKFLTLFLCWSAYQLQSIASINQLGLAVWGWLFGGLIIAIGRTQPIGEHDKSKLIQEKSKSSKSTKSLNTDILDASTTLKILASTIVGLLIALPPFINDARMRSFFSANTGEVEKIVSLGESWPVDNLRLNKIIVSLAKSNQNDQARELAAFAALKFPNDYVSWWALDQLTRDGIPEKEFLRERLHKIDPYNPTYFKK